MKISEKCKQLKEMFPNYESNTQYINNKDRLMDITMSCTAEESLTQLQVILNQSDKQIDVLTLLAAYDLYMHIYNNMNNKFTI